MSDVLCRGRYDIGAGWWHTGTPPLPVARGPLRVKSLADTTGTPKRAIQDTLAKHLAVVKIAGASVHSLRHTMTTHHIARGTDLKTIHETLGHADLATTAHSLYVSLAKQARRRAL